MAGAGGRERPALRVQMADAPVVGQPATTRPPTTVRTEAILKLSPLFFPNSESGCRRRVVGLYFAPEIFFAINFPSRSPLSSARCPHPSSICHDTVHAGHNATGPRARDRDRIVLLAGASS